MASGASILKKFDSKFSKKKTGSAIFDHSQIRNLLDDYKASARDIIEITKDAYWEVGTWIAFEAAIRCPVDTGTMESSIGLKTLEGRSVSKFTLILEYDPGITYPRDKYKDGRTTGKMFDLIHDGMWPEGDLLMPSARSTAKGARWGVVTGGGFMRRAIDENSEEIKARIFEAVRNGIAKQGLQKKKYRMYVSKRGKKYRVGVDDDL